MIVSRDYSGVIARRAWLLRAVLIRSAAEIPGLVGKHDLQAIRAGLAICRPATGIRTGTSAAFSAGAMQGTGSLQTAARQQ